ncbi:[FeFe] hydrogenase H-cluster radical SAM maturase HydE [Ethanoligenens harbinense]|uniref:Radical SAM domain protein n=1 Tax=Ethanoligenens harbinense (strain DSM 18485 / JCM 12961 / CGMCC 1.5033 / YUAN-3) TaxID=663278 RepID=E6U5H3_ETHHY|nr:[FeFe] hydrogenase H-cluster radical SAM maturase HydE [Ethanoligenens harbinense]ADU25640.1 Radical SAM domain protein [Ethanoligenens harbinense YUAN-3]AVQ94815.1 [FeFe] hydrogenase H-cluster radical SAM maturase HydE [Ethanoligenens harbinense YUAN-3]AYF37505.1 [FeFe] hydrogenase H-cluster radical SAM maturase HydE [Ethanoligenens harbinense]AYF40225.1 [FeFe] hydrogenase H-cluster radical SAM maturase HydE [Ethanoligenens harbinense]QCN91061.1 [FeFe] hydrogenase H-cluster radical SAM mat
MLHAAECTDIVRHGDKPALAALIAKARLAGETERAALFNAADAARRPYYGKNVYFRGLIEFTSYCKNDCYYCGIRAGNRNARHYRLTAEEIWACAAKGYALGFRTFVLQGGEDPWYTDARICEIVSGLKERHADCAVTLSIGEKSFESYKRYYDAGADRFLLRHETANDAHYRLLHPPELSLAHRKQCLYDLRAIGYQVGAGFMVESPGQTDETLAEDFLFLRELQPHMVGIGPFVPHHDTRYAGLPTPTADFTLVLLSLLRLMLPKVLLPATTALGTVDPLGREKGLRAGANVVMPNLSPVTHRKDYMLYDNKICTGEEAAECLQCLSRRIASAGFIPDFGRGDHADRVEKAARA